MNHLPNDPSTEVRQLWDEARKPTATWRDWRNVLSYELQPFPLSNGIDDILHVFKSLMEDSITSVSDGINFLWLRVQIRHFLWLFVFYMYWKFLKVIHGVLDAGPFFLILTLLVLIFTVGLKDENHKPNGYLSAYSVFNKGMQNILGSVNADQLLAQYVGGTGIDRFEPHLNDDNNNNAVGRYHQHRPPPEQQQDYQLNEQRQEHDDRDFHRPRPRTTRKSNKKLRRKTNQNLELKQEMQRQREVARDMGFGEEGGEAEVLAMNLLLDLQ